MAGATLTHALVTGAARGIGRAIAEDRAEAIVLGCAGMTDLAERLAVDHRIPVLDGVSCAVALCESMVRLKLRTSRLGGYAPVPQNKLAHADDTRTS